MYISTSTNGQHSFNQVLLISLVFHPENFYSFRSFWVSASLFLFRSVRLFSVKCIRLVWLDFDLYYVFGLIFGVLFSALCLGAIVVNMFVAGSVFVYVTCVYAYARFTFSLYHTHKTFGSLLLCFTSKLYCRRVLFHAMYYIEIFDEVVLKNRLIWIRFFDCVVFI